MTGEGVWLETPYSMRVSGRDPLPEDESTSPPEGASGTGLIACAPVRK